MALIAYALTQAGGAACIMHVLPMRAFFRINLYTLDFLNCNM